MNVFSNMVAQGDVIFEKVESIPTEAKPEAKKGPIIVTHSETGHHHAIDDMATATLFKLENDPLVCYLRVEGLGATVTHHRSFDTHDPVSLAPGDWRVRRQREFVPGGWKRVED